MKKKFNRHKYEHNHEEMYSIELKICKKTQK